MIPQYLTPQTRHHVAQYIMGMELDRPVKVLFKPVSQRSIEQNKKLHAMLQDVSRDASWCGRKLSVTQWKRLFVAAVKQQETLPGLEGGVVVVSDNSSSELSVERCGEVIEYIQAWGNDNGVRWTDEGNT